MFSFFLDRINKINRIFLNKILSCLSCYPVKIPLNS